MPTSVTHQGHTRNQIAKPVTRETCPPSGSDDGLSIPLGLGLGLLPTSRTHDVGGVVMGDSSRTPAAGSNPRPTQET